MNTRSIISLALALILLVAALPAGANHTLYNSDSYCRWNGASIANFSFDGSDGINNDWKLSWDTVPHAVSRVMQIKGGGITSVWTTVWPTRMYKSVVSGETYYEMTPLAQEAGKTLYFRININCNGGGGFYGWTPTAETSKD